MLEKSCGTIPYTVKDDKIHYLLLRAKDDGYCGFPKGHVEANETEEETAFRETWEEASIKSVINSDFRYEISYKMDNGNEKLVVYFLASFFGQEPSHNDGFEHHDYLLLPFEKACQMLTFENARTMLKEANNLLIQTNSKNITHP
ncbi:MAG: NUDIX domain-containing protein [Clostridia bacterium]|nr:NUDIX domain-containing protein [Clostridia bacterium]